jgi:flagellar biosynthesis/type III secretory pathway protein FliH
MKIAVAPVPAAPSFGLLFAEDFDMASGVTVVAETEDEREADEPEVIAPSFSARDVRAAQDRAYADGLRDGREAAAADQQDAVRAALAMVAERLRSACDDAVRANEAAANDVAATLLAAISVAFPVTCGRAGPREAAAFAGAILPSLRREPRVAVRIHGAAMAAMEAEIHRLDQDLQDRITIAPSAAASPGDVRITWQDAVAVRDEQALWRTVIQALAPLGLFRESDLANASLMQEASHA